MASIQPWDIFAMPTNMRRVIYAVVDPKTGEVTAYRIGTLNGRGFFPDTVHITTLGREFTLDIERERVYLKRRGRHGVELNMIDEGSVVPDCIGSRVMVAEWLLKKHGVVPKPSDPRIMALQV